MLGSRVTRTGGIADQSEPYSAGEQAEKQTTTEGERCEQSEADVASDIARLLRSDGLMCNKECGSACATEHRHGRQLLKPVNRHRRHCRRVALELGHSDKREAALSVGDRARYVHVL
jgi:hypothetical protein